MVSVVVRARAEVPSPFATTTPHVIPVSYLLHPPPLGSLLVSHPLPLVATSSLCVTCRLGEAWPLGQDGGPPLPEEELLKTQIEVYHYTPTTLLCTAATTLLLHYYYTTTI